MLLKDLTLRRCGRFALLKLFRMEVDRELELEPSRVEFRELGPMLSQLCGMWGLVEERLTGMMEGGPVELQEVFRRPRSGMRSSWSRDLIAGCSP